MLNKENLIEIILKKGKAIITKDAAEFLNEIFPRISLKVNLNEIINEISSIEGIITKEKIKEIIDRKLKEETKEIKKEIIDTTILVEKEIKEIHTITDGYLGFLQDRYIKMKKIIEKIYRKKSNINSLFLKNLKNKTNIVIGGILFKKSYGKFNSIILEMEDLNGKFRAIVPNYIKDAFKIAENLDEDEIVLIEGTLIKDKNQQYIKVSKIYQTDLELSPLIIKEKKEKNYLLCISDIRYGNEKFQEKSFEKLINVINGKFEEYKEIVDKIKAIVIAGDLIEGISYETKYKGQIFDELTLQFKGISELLSKIKNEISIYIVPGERDSIVNLIPLQGFDREIAEPLYNIKNASILKDPSFLEIDGRKILITHGYYFENIFRKKMFEYDTKEKMIIAAMKYVLKKRNLLPNLNVKGLLPIGYDPFVIFEKPDIFICGHYGIAAHEMFKQCLLVSNSSWIKFNENEISCVCYLIDLSTLNIKKLIF